MFLESCGSYNMLSSMLFMKSAVEIISMSVFLLLIIFVGIELAKIVLDPNTDMTKKRVKSIITKFVAGAIVFFIPTLVNILITNLDAVGNKTSYCWKVASSDMLEVYKNAEEVKQKAEDEKAKKENEKAEVERQTVQKIKEAAAERNRKKAEEERKKQEQSKHGSATAEELLLIAQQQVGICGRPNKFTQGYGSIGGYSYHWCAAFVWWCSNEAGVYPDKVSMKTAGVDAFIGHFKSKNQYKVSQGHGGNYTPKMGDYIFFNWSGYAGSGDHVGLVKSVSGSNVITIEGNNGDCVKECSYPLNSATIIGYGVWE